MVALSPFGDVVCCEIYDKCYYGKPEKGERY